MLFTGDGLEQATRFEVAAGHAHRFAQASLATVHDLGCGIGSDAMALSAFDVTVAAIDADPVTALFADTESRARGRPPRAASAESRTASPPRRQRPAIASEPGWIRRAGLRTDRRSRPARRRVFSLEEIAPSWERSCWPWRRRCRRRGRSCPRPFRTTGSREGARHSGSHGRARSSNARSGGVRWRGHDGTHRSGARAPRPPTPGEVTEDRGHRDPVAAGGPQPGPGRRPWLYEADRALVQAGLVGAVTAATDGRELEPGLGFVTADAAYDLGFARRYAVTAALPFTVKAVRAWLRARGVTSLTVKKRGVRLDDEALRRQLKVRAGDEGTMLLTRVAGRRCALMLDPTDRRDAVGPAARAWLRRGSGAAVEPRHARPATARPRTGRMPVPPARS